MIKNAVISLPYFGDVSFYKHYKKDLPLIEAHENYQKKSLRNKTKILSANGPLLLSVPLKKGKHKKRKYQEVQIAYDENWVKKHLDSIKAAYGNSPYFEFYFPEIQLILKSQYTVLWKLNLSLFKFCLNSMQLENDIMFTEDYRLAKEYLCDYRNFAYTTANISYHQVFQHKYEFQNNLSILDMLFNLGPECNAYLK